MNRYKVSFEELGRYYKSPYWNMVRGLLMYQRGGKCEKCGSPLTLQAHHKTYDHLFSELSYMGDMQLLCRDCHEAVTNAARAKRKRWF